MQADIEKMIFSERLKLELQRTKDMQAAIKKMMDEKEKKGKEKPPANT